MALRKRGKNGTYHAYFRTVMSLPDGRLKYATTTVNLYTCDLIEARALEAELMAKNKAARMHQRATAKIRQLEVAAGMRPVEDLPRPIIREQRKRRLKLADGIATAEKYRHVSRDSAKIWNRFVRDAGCVYFDEVTSDLALAYLQKKYGGPESGKSFDNNKSALSAIFKFCMVDAGVELNPFSVIPMRRFKSQHQRPFTEEEFRRIYRAAAEPWKTAALIAWHTGLREESVFNLEWGKLDGDVITVTPGKTARFGRSVQIPLHPQVMQRLSELPRVNGKIFGCFKFSMKSSGFRLYFGQLLSSLGITDNEIGIVNFNSFRDSFITRCDEAGIPRHAIRGIVGHLKDEVTDLYSHDIVSARQVQQLRDVKLG